MLTFQYIATYASLIPFVDFSNASEYHKLSEQQHQIREIEIQIQSMKNFYIVNYNK